MTRHTRDSANCFLTDAFDASIADICPACEAASDREYSKVYDRWYRLGQKAAASEDWDTARAAFQDGFDAPIQDKESTTAIGLPPCE